MRIDKSKVKNLAIKFLITILVIFVFRQQIFDICDACNLSLGMRLAVLFGADLEAREEGRTALIFAAESADVEKVRLLLELGADPDVKYSDGVPLMAYSKNEADNKYDKEIVRLLEMYSARKR